MCTMVIYLKSFYYLPSPCSCFLSSHIPDNGKGNWGKEKLGEWFPPSTTGGRFFSPLRLWIKELWFQEWSGAVRGCGVLISSCHHGGGPSDLRLQGGHLPPEGHVRGQLPAPASCSVLLYPPAPSAVLSQDQDLQLPWRDGPGQQVCQTQRRGKPVLHHTASSDQRKLPAESHVQRKEGGFHR